MKKFLWIVVAVLVSAAGLAGCGAKGPSVQEEPGVATNPMAVNFEATDLNGNTVTQQIFADHKVTYVHRWATWCAPCVSEMGTLAQLVGEYKDNPDVGFLFMVIDGADSPERAKQIMNQAALGISSIPLNETVNNYFQHNYVPATQMVDSEGNPVGEPIVGSVPIEQYRQAIEEALSGS